MAERRRTKRNNDVEDFIVDFRKEVKSTGGGIRVKPGTYAVRVLSAKPVVSEEKGTKGLQVTFVFTDGKYKGKKIVERLWLAPKAYGRFRTLLEACDKKVPTKINAVRIAAAIKGADLYVELQDDKSDGYPTRSRVSYEGFISVDDFDEDDNDDDDDEEDDDEDDDDDTDEEDDDDDDEDEDDDDDEDDDEDDEPVAKKRKPTPAKGHRTKAKPKRRQRPADDDDEDDDDLDLDEL